MTRTIRTLAACVVCVASAVPTTAQTRRDVREETVRRRQEAALAQVLSQVQAQRRGAPGVPTRRRNAATAEATEPFSHTLRLGRGATFELHNVAGDVTVTGGGGNNARIEAVKRVRATSDAAARSLLKRIQIQIVERGGSVDVRTLHPRVNTGLLTVEYTVTVPSSTSVILRSGSGNLRVRNVDGEVRAESESGNLTAADLKQIRALRSISGHIEVTDSEADEFNVNTALGNVVVRKLKGRLLDFRTVTGNMLLQEISADRARLQSTNGDLEFAGRLARSGRYQFQTHGGNIRVVPSGNQGFDLEAVTYSGNLRSDFALDGAEPAPQPRRMQKTLRGTFGNAGAVVTASTFSGNIVLMKP